MRASNFSIRHLEDYYLVLGVIFDGSFSISMISTSMNFKFCFPGTNGRRCSFRVNFLNRLGGFGALEMRKRYFSLGCSDKIKHPFDISPLS